MITSYNEQRLEDSIKEDLVLLNNLSRVYNMLKLTPSNEIQQISFSLNPKVVDIQKFAALKNVCLDFNFVIAELYSNIDQLVEFYRSYASEDEFLGLILKLHDRIQNKGGNRNKPVIYLNRNDFMYDQGLEKFQQIEYNLIAPSQGFNCQNTSNLLHHYYSIHKEKNLHFIKNDYNKFSADAFSKFMSYYPNPNAYVGIVIMDIEANIFEIIQLEQVLLSVGIKSTRIHASELLNKNFKVDETNNLFFKDKELAIVYYRIFYDPSHYINDSEDFIVTAELSNAMCIPTIDLLLINMKLNQLLLFNKTLRTKYMSDIDLSFFDDYLCPHYSLKFDFNDDKQLMIKEVESNFNNYILKTFREGGNCDIITGKDIVDIIKSKSENELNAYMLVRKVKAHMYPSYVWNNGQLVYHKESVSEISIFNGTVMTMKENGTWSVDWQTGGEYLLRSKASTAAKGGIMVNIAFIDSLISEN